MITNLNDFKNKLNENLTEGPDAWWNNLSPDEKHQIMQAKVKRFANTDRFRPQYSTSDEMTNIFTDVIVNYYGAPKGDPEAYKKFREALDDFNTEYNMTLVPPSEHLMANGFDSNLSNALGDKEGEKLSKEDIQMAWSQALGE